MCRRVWHEGKRGCVDGCAGRSVFGVIRRRSIRFVHLRFASVFNALGGMTVASDRLRGTLGGGYVFSNSSVRKFMQVRRSSVCLCPSLSAFAVFP